MFINTKLHNIIIKKHVFSKVLHIHNKVTNKLNLILKERLSIKHKQIIFLTTLVLASKNNFSLISLTIVDLMKY